MTDARRSPASATLLLMLATAAAAGELQGPPAPAASGWPAANATSDARPCICRPRGCPSEASPSGEPRLRSRRDGVASGIVLGLALGAGLGARSETSGVTAPAPGSFGGTDYALVTAGLAGLVGPAVLDRDPPVVGTGAWSDCRADGGSALNGLDRRGRGLAAGLSLEGRQRAELVSDVTLHAALAEPLGVVLADSTLPDRGRNTLVVAETYLVTIGLTQLLKHVWHRPRPFAHFGDPPTPGLLHEHHAQMSFPSGHASSSFAGAVVAGMLASQHGHSNAAWIWTSGLTLATATGVLRIAADRHYVTDVVAGAALGSLVGWLVPHLHRPQPLPDAVGAEPARGVQPALAAPALSVKLSGRADAGDRGAWMALSLGAQGAGVGVAWRW